MGYCGRLGPAAEVDWYAPFTVTVLVLEALVAITTCGSRISVPGGCDDEAMVAWLCARPRGILAFVNLCNPEKMDKIPSRFLRYRRNRGMFVVEVGLQRSDRVVGVSEFHYGAFDEAVLLLVDGYFGFGARRLKFRSRSQIIFLE